MAASRPWKSGDRTGGPLDDILRTVQLRFPDALVSRLVGTHHAADDKNVYWVQLAGLEVQIDTAPGGAPPFTVESNGPYTRLDTDDVGAVEEHIGRLFDTANDG